MDEVKKKKNIRSNLIKYSPENEIHSARKNNKNKELIQFLFQNLSTIDKFDISFDEFIYLIGKINKTNQEFKLVMKYLEDNQLFCLFKLNQIDKDIYAKILYTVALNLKKEDYNKGENIIKNGSSVEKFFLLLKGKLSIMKEVSYTNKMTTEEYCKHLTELKELGELVILNKTLNKNSIFPIGVNDIDKLKDIFFKVGLRTYLMSMPSINDIENFFNEKGQKLTEFKIDKLIFEYHRSETIQSKKELYQKVIGILKQLLSNKDLSNFYFLESNEKKAVTCYRYEKIGIIESNQYFGDVLLDSFNAVSNVVVIAENDSVLGSIGEDVYYEVIYQEKMKIKNKYSTHIVNDFFLRSINLLNFMDNYFHLFSLCNYEQGKILFNEKDELDYIYFIKEGEVEISFVKDIIEMINVIKELQRISLDSGESPRNEIEERIEDLLLEAKSYNMIKNNIKVYILTLDFGMEEYIYGLSRIYQAKIISQNSQIFKIHNRDLSRILKKENTTKNLLKISAKGKLMNLVKRIVEIKEIIMNRANLAAKSNCLPLIKKSVNKNDLTIQSITVNIPKAYKELIENKFNNSVATSENYNNYNHQSTNPDRNDKKLKNNNILNKKICIIPAIKSNTIKEDKEIKKIEEEMFNLKFFRHISDHNVDRSIKPYKEITNNDVFKKYLSKVAIVNLLDFDNKFYKILRNNKSLVDTITISNESYILKTEENEKKGEKMKINFKPLKVKKSPLKINKNSIFLLTNN